MTETEHSILQLLRARGPMLLEAIAKTMGIETFRASFCLDQLEQAKLVRLEASVRSCLWCANIVDAKPVRDSAPPQPSPERVALARLAGALSDWLCAADGDDSAVTRSELVAAADTARAVLGGGK